MKNKPNSEIKRKMKEAGVYQWEVAEEMGIHEVTLARLLRRPLDKENAERLTRAVDTVSRQKAAFN